MPRPIVLGGMHIALTLSFVTLSFHAFASRPKAVAAVDAGVKVEQKIAYLGSPNNIKLSNGTVELVLATDYGPRIMRYALAGAPEEGNVFATIPPDKPNLKTELGDWFIRGGHRLWHAPEAVPRSYVPDDSPVEVKFDGATVKLIQPVEKVTHIQKEVWITLDPQGSHVTVLHKLTNKGLFTVTMSCWAMSAMNKGGIAILPQEPYQSHDDEVRPARSMTVWGYTDLTDPRWMIGKSVITLTQNPDITTSQKIGILNKQGWSAYFHAGALFVKRFAYEKGKEYPDLGCNNETYADGVFLELETLGPLEKVDPGQAISFQEDWWLYKNIDIGNGEAGIAAALQPILTQTSHKPGN